MADDTTHGALWVLQRALVKTLVGLDSLLDRIPIYDTTDQQWYRQGDWGCRFTNLAIWSSDLDERWDTGVWVSPTSESHKDWTVDLGTPRQYTAHGGWNVRCECGVLLGDTNDEAGLHAAHEAHLREVGQ